MACDDGFDEICTTPEQKCLVHKHQLCDNITDCKRGSDEDHELCRNMKDDESERVITGRNATIPLDWLCDGVVDCKDGKDHLSKMRTKATGGCVVKDIYRKRCRSKSHECEEQFSCPQSKP